jgi:hypothetical protein
LLLTPFVQKHLHPERSLSGVLVNMRASRRAATTVMGGRDTGSWAQHWQISSHTCRPTGSAQLINRSYIALGL